MSINETDHRFLCFALKHCLTDLRSIKMLVLHLNVSSMSNYAAFNTSMYLFIQTNIAWLNAV